MTRRKQILAYCFVPIWWVMWALLFIVFVPVLGALFMVNTVGGASWRVACRDVVEALLTLCEGFSPKFLFED